MNTTKIFIITPQEGHTLVHLKIFAISKFLQCKIGQVKDVKRLNNGSILVEAASNQYAVLLAQLDNFVNTPVSCCRHGLLNSSYGVIRCRELCNCEEDEIVDDLKHQIVVAAKQLTSNCNGSLH